MSEMKPEFLAQTLHKANSTPPPSPEPLAPKWPCSKCGRTGFQLINTNLSDPHNPIWVCGYCLQKSSPEKLKEVAQRIAEYQENNPHLNLFHSHAQKFITKLVTESHSSLITELENVCIEKQKLEEANAGLVRELKEHDYRLKLFGWNPKKGTADDFLSRLNGEIATLQHQLQSLLRVLTAISEADIPANDFHPNVLQEWCYKAKELAQAAIDAAIQQSEKDKK